MAFKVVFRSAGRSKGMLASPRLALIVPGFFDPFNGLLLAVRRRSRLAGVGQKQAVTTGKNCPETAPSSVSTNLG
jgi:hypothetical protein